MQDFEPLSVIGEGHFGKVLLVRWNNGASATPPPPPPPTTTTTSRNSIIAISSSGRHTRLLPATATIKEGAEEGKDKDGAAAAAEDAMTRSGRHGGDRYLAVKEVALHKNTSLPGVLNERQILGVLREHPFVVTLRCAWRRGNFLYYGLDFLPGADLFELFRRNSIKMDLAAARVYGGQVVLALEHLHEHGICYRDLKVRACRGGGGRVASCVLPLFFRCRSRRSRVCVRQMFFYPVLSPFTALKCCSAWCLIK